jgi:hydrogenase expression/formation protein HypE
MSIDKILLDHGSGGKASHSLIADLLVPEFKNPILAQLNDSAVFDIEGKRLAFSTDTYVVDPIFFPGGNIGHLAVNGTVNDLAMCGATPLYLSVGLIIEEGFSMADLKKILKAMREAARKADVLIVTGDTKVVPNGAADKIFINTSGVGLIPEGTNISGHNARPGDKIIISGTIADHGITVLTQREGMTFKSPIYSDTAPLNHMVREMIAASNQVHALRDPTRGGVGTSLNEIAAQSKVGIKIYEEALPTREEVSAICELLGFDPLYVANEGKLLAFVGPGNAEKILETIKGSEYGKDACIIGEVVADPHGKVFMKTRIAGTRIVNMLTGEQLPRIC